MAKVGLVFLCFLGMLLLVILPRLRVDELVLRAPELFGVSKGYMIRGLNGGLLGIVIGCNHNPGESTCPVEAYALFWLFSGRKTCLLGKGFGGEIYQMDAPLLCFVEWRGGAAFRGWIDFRGHARPFCGGLTVEMVPAHCKSDLGW